MLLLFGRYHGNDLLTHFLGIADVFGFAGFCTLACEIL